MLITTARIYSIQCCRFWFEAVAILFFANAIDAFRISYDAQQYHRQCKNQIRTAATHIATYDVSSSSSSLLRAFKSPNNQDDDVYEDQMEEIIAMGGDPFFMDSNSSDNKDSIEDFNTYLERKEAQEERIAEIEAAGGDPSFLLDDDFDYNENERLTLMERQEEVRIKESPASNNESSRSNRKEESPSPMSASSIFGLIGSGGSPFDAGAEDDSTDSFDTPPNDMNFDQSAAIEAMGGDPFFLKMDDDKSLKDINDPSNQDNDDDDPAALSALASMAMSSGGGVMDLLGMSTGTANSPSPPPASSMDMTRAALEDMGGDPFFLDSVDDDTRSDFNDDNDGDDGTSDSSSVLSQMAFASGSDVVADILGRANRLKDGKQSNNDENIPSSKCRNDNNDDDERDENWEWDGIVDEDAHLDLY